MEKKVLVFGTFDVFHFGHFFFLKEAKKEGKLFVVVARDETVKKLKGKEPILDEKKRKKIIEMTGLAKKTFLGDKKDPFKIIKKIKPDIICLGYDQKFFVNGLKKFLKKEKLPIKIKRIKSFLPNVFKSSFYAPSKKQT